MGILYADLPGSVVLDFRAGLIQSHIAASSAKTHSEMARRDYTRCIHDCQNVPAPFHIWKEQIVNQQTIPVTGNIFHTFLSVFRRCDMLVDTICNFLDSFFCDSSPKLQRF